MSSAGPISSRSRPVSVSSNIVLAQSHAHCQSRFVIILYEQMCIDMQKSGCEFTQSCSWRRNAFALAQRRVAPCACCGAMQLARLLSALCQQAGISRSSFSKTTFQALRRLLTVETCIARQAKAQAERILLHDIQASKAFRPTSHGSILTKPDQPNPALVRNVEPADPIIVGIKARMTSGRRSKRR